MSNPVQTGGFDLWITDRINFYTLAPRVGGTGLFDQWITDRIVFETVASPVPAAPASTSFGHSPYSRLRRNRCYRHV